MPLNIPILIGTTRPNNESQHVAQLVHRHAQAVDELHTHIVDPAQLNLPGDGNDPAGRDPEFTRITAEADGFILIVPEYNHSFSGSLKRLLDSESTNYIHKPVTMVGVSSGYFGGVRAIEHLTAPLRELGLIVSFADVYVTNVKTRFDEAGELVSDVERYEKNLAEMLSELQWLAETLQYGRKSLPSKYH